ncbi:MAG: 30S ribosomal protein S17e [Candidatus Micrarchaeia archaeon]|jgi:ribosomal protein S17E
MGSQKGKHVNTAAKALIEEYPDKFSVLFDENKKRLTELEAVDYSKEERNKLAAAITNRIKARKPRETV